MKKEITMSSKTGKSSKKKTSEKKSRKKTVAAPAQPTKDLKVKPPIEEGEFDVHIEEDFKGDIEFFDHDDDEDEDF